MNFLKEERLFALTSNRLDLILVSFGSFLLTWTFTLLLNILSPLQETIFITIGTMVISSFFVYKKFVWLHFLDNKIIVRYPLKNLIIEFPLWKIERTGIKPAAKSTQYFIEYYEKGELQTIGFVGVISNHGQLKNYFLSRGIVFKG